MESETNPHLKSALRLVQGEDVVRVVHAGKWTGSQIQSLHEMEVSEGARRFRPIGPLTRKTLAEGSVIVPKDELEGVTYATGEEASGTVYSEDNPDGAYYPRAR